MNKRVSGFHYRTGMSICAVTAMLCTTVPAQAQDLNQAQSQPQSQEFGRFFTSPEQRVRLDNLRSGRPEVVIKITEQDLVDEQPQTPAGPPQDALTVKGVVRRHGGASTAWINDSNTYEGDLASQYITVDENDIHDNRVLLKITGSGEDIEVKVGETYDPDSDHIVDIVQDPGVQNISRVK